MKSVLKSPWSSPPRTVGLSIPGSASRLVYRMIGLLNLLDENLLVGSIDHIDQPYVVPFTPEPLAASAGHRLVDIFKPVTAHYEPKSRGIFHILPIRMCSGGLIQNRPGSANMSPIRCSVTPFAQKNRFTNQPKIFFNCFAVKLASIVVGADHIQITTCYCD